MVAPIPLARSDSDWPRYSRRPLPPYRYVPGMTPHPRRDAAGHSLAADEPICDLWEPEQWRGLTTWLYGVDLYNRAYWWESHEQLEALWIAAGRTSAHARFVQGLLQIAAALLNRQLGRHGAGRLASLGVSRMRGVTASHRGCYMGVEVAEFTAAVEDLFADLRSAHPLVRLDF